MPKTLSLAAMNRANFLPGNEGGFLGCTAIGEESIQSASDTRPPERQVLQ